MTDAPSPVAAAQLEELGIEVSAGTSSEDDDNDNLVMD